MATKAKLLRALIVGARSPLVEQLTRLLQTHGYELQGTFLEAGKPLPQTPSQHYDLALIPTDADDHTIATAMAQPLRRRIDLSVLLLSDGRLPERALALLQPGVRDVLDLGRPDLLLHSLTRELHDLQTRRRLQESQASLQEWQRRCTDLFQRSGDAIAYLQASKHLAHNRAYALRLGFNGDESLVGTAFADLITDDHQRALTELFTNFSQGMPLPDSIDLHLRGPKGVPIPIHLLLSAVTYHHQPCIAIYLRDAGNHKEMENRLRILKNQDLLTGLFNRHYFLDKLDDYIRQAQQAKASHALFYIDIDQFQETQKRLGVTAGDQLLVEVAERLRTLLQITNFPTRYDGSVFTVLYRDLTIDQAEIEARRVCRSLAQHTIDLEGEAWAVTCSIGVSAINNTTLDGNEVLNRAYKACATARAAGGDQVHTYIPMDAEPIDRERLAQWTTRIEQALEEERLHLVYQPIVSLHGLAGEQYEVLLRMRDPQGNEVFPGQFLPAAEHSGLMPQLDRWVVHQALQDLIDKRRSGSDTSLFIKLSTTTLLDNGFTTWLGQQCNEVDCRPDKLVFEISEEVVLANLKQVKHFTTRLRQLGCLLALDHFGRSDNSAAIQRHLNARFLKLDGRIIRDMTRNEGNVEQVKALTAIATATSAQTIAQFVEDANCLALLWQTGVHYIQGYFVQEPSTLMRYDFSENV